MAEKTFVHISPSKKDADLPDTGSTKGICPTCGERLQMGFGMAGGGYGPYEYCDSEQCNRIVTKTEVEE